MQLARVVDTWRRVREVPGRLDKTSRIAECLSGAAPEELGVAVAWLSARLPQGRVGLGPARIRDAADVAPATDPTLEVADVDATLDRIAAASGPGSAGRRRELLRGVFARATRSEQSFLAALLLGELRQGASEGVLVEAVARSTGVPAAKLRRAHMLTGDLSEVARAARAEGASGLARLGLELFRPVRPMLAATAADVEDALAALGEASWEWKLDGARVQVHKDGDTVRAFSRQLRDVTGAVPEVVETVRGLPARRLVLDGEVLAVGAEGRPRPFQTTMRRFGRRVGAGDLRAGEEDLRAGEEDLRAELPLRCFFFDCLLVDDDELLDEPLVRRAAALDAVAGPARVPARVTADPAEAAAFLAEARARGHEGLVAKGLDASYAAGSRGASWRKVKPAHTLDLVVLAAEWGSGRRRGLLSNLHLGARDPHGGGFVMLGKTFKGLTDAMLAWQTRRLLELEVAREGHVVHVAPRLVVEVAFDGVQTSPRYPAGMALRFARVKRFREDKPPGQADTVDTVRALHAVSAGAGDGLTPRRGSGG